MNRFKMTLAMISAAATFGLAGSAHAGSTLDAIQKKGFIQCGVSDGLPGFGVPDSQGKMTGIDVDVCHAVAAAVFGDASKVKFTQLTAKERFTALQSGEIDVISRNTTWTSSRDSGMGLVFTGVTYYDGIGFLVNSKLGVTAARQLDGATVCIQAGTTTELNVSDYFRTHGMKFTPITFGLSAPEDHMVLPEVISKEPLGPLVRKGDDEWFSIVKWTLFAMLNAEEMGITSQNVEEQAKTTKNPDVARLLGADGEYGKDLKLRKDWVVQIVKQVGNYGEVFERNIGQGSVLKIKRGLNALWNNGGIQYAPPVR